MMYLEVKSFIHRDLAARNILVSEDGVCKVMCLSIAIKLMFACILERLQTLGCQGNLMKIFMCPMEGKSLSSGQPLKHSTIASTPWPVMSGAMGVSSMRYGHWERSHTVPLLMIRFVPYSTGRQAGRQTYVTTGALYHTCTNVLPVVTCML